MKNGTISDALELMYNTQSEFDAQRRTREFSDHILSNRIIMVAPAKKIGKKWIC